jgi:hypothetical protein
MGVVLLPRWHTQRRRRRSKPPNYLSIFCWMCVEQVPRAGDGDGATGQGHTCLASYVPSCIVGKAIHSSCFAKQLCCFDKLVVGLQPDWRLHTACPTNSIRLA